MDFVFEESLTRTQALANYAQEWKPEPRIEVVDLAHARGRVLAEDLHVKYDLPVVRSSRMDGVAVRSADFADGIPDTSNWVAGVDFARADTGDDFDDAFDAVIAIEDVTLDEAGRPTFNPETVTEVKPGQDVAPCGSLAKKGALIAYAHTMMTAETVAGAAVGGYAQVKVYARPRVAFVPTGTELVQWGAVPKRGQNIEANSLLVSGMVEEMGGEAICYPLVKDDKADLEAALDRALEAADIVIVNAGSSKGSEDYNSQMLKARSTYFRHGVRCVPGRPVGMAVIDGRPVVNVPGPVIGTWLCMEWLIRGLVTQWWGAPAVEKPTVKATLGFNAKMPKPMERLIRMHLVDDGDGGLRGEEIGRHECVPQTISRTDATFFMPADVQCIPAGTEVEVTLQRPLSVIKAEWGK
jgi:molybdopterin molybdotransferase